MQATRHSAGPCLRGQALYRPGSRVRGLRRTRPRLVPLQYVKTTTSPTTAEPVTGEPVTVKQQLVETQTYQQLKHAIEQKPALHDDWLSFTSRPWVRGPVDTVLANPRMASFAARQPQLQQRVADLLHLVDLALLQVTATGPGGTTAAGVPSGDGPSTALPVWRPPVAAAPAAATAAPSRISSTPTADQPTAPPSASAAASAAPGLLSTAAALINAKLAHSSVSMDGWDPHATSDLTTALPGKQTRGQDSSAFVAWAVSLLDQASRHGAIYIIMEAMELLLTEDKIAALEAFSNAAVTEPRLLKLVAILEGALTSGRVAGCSREVMALLSKEHTDRLLALSERVLDDEGRILAAGALLDHLMADVSMDDALGVAAALDRAFDVALQSQALGAALDALAAPGAGEALGRGLEVVLTEERVDLYVHTMDEVLSQERLSQLPALLAAVSPALDATSIGRLAAALRTLLHSKDLRVLLDQLQQQLTLARLDVYMVALDHVVSGAAVGRLLDAGGVLLDGGRWWALQGQAPPALLQKAVVLHSHGRRSAAGARSRPGSSSSSSYDGARGSTSSRDEPAAGDGQHATSSSASSNNRSGRVSAFASRYGASPSASAASTRGSSPAGAFSGVGGDPFHPHSLPGRSSLAHWGVAPLHVYSDAELEAILNHYLPSGASRVPGYTTGDTTGHGDTSTPAAAAVTSQLLHGDCVGDDCVMCTIAAPAPLAASDLALLKRLGDPALQQLVFQVADEVMQPRVLRQLSACLQQALQPAVLEAAGGAMDEVLRLKELSAAYQGPSCSLNHAPAAPGLSPGTRQQQEQEEGRLAPTSAGAAVGAAHVLTRVLAAAAAAAGPGASSQPVLRHVVRAVAATAGSPLQQQHLVEGLQAGLGLWAAWERTRAAAGDLKIVLAGKQAVLASRDETGRWEELSRVVGRWMGCCRVVMEQAGQVAASSWCCWWALHTNLALEQGRRG